MISFQPIIQEKELIKKELGFPKEELEKEDIEIPVDKLFDLLQKEMGSNDGKCKVHDKQHKSHNSFTSTIGEDTKSSYYHILINHNEKSYCFREFGCI